MTFLFGGQFARLLQFNVSRSKTKLGHLGAARPIFPRHTIRFSFVFGCNNRTVPKLCLLFHFPKDNLEYTHLLL